MNKNRGIIGIGLILAIILGIVVVGGGAYYLGKSGVKQEVKNQEINQSQNLPVDNSKQVNITNPTVPPVTTGCTSSSVPSITVLSPNGGEVYKAGDKITVKWSSCNIPATHKFYIDLMPNVESQGSPASTILSNSTINDGIEVFNLNVSDTDLYYTVFIKDNDLPNGSTNAWSKKFTINSAKAVSLDMSSELARTYTTAFTNALKQPANFNGHYSIASWGCGSGCLGYGIVDKLTGKVYQGPSDDYGNTAGYSGDADFTKTRWSINSNLFKVIGYTSIDTYKFENEKFTKIGSTPFPKKLISTTDWKTYTNTECGYSFQYPDSWSQGNESNAINLQGTVMGRMIDFIDTASQGIERADGSNNQIYAPKDNMHIDCYTMGTSVYDDELSRYNNSSDIFAQNKKKITVGGQTAIVGEMRNTATVSGGAHPGHTVIPSHDMYVFFMHKDQTRALYFVFDTPLNGNDTAEIANFEKLLTTFKFN